MDENVQTSVPFQNFQKSQFRQNGTYNYLFIYLFIYTFG